MTMTTSYFLNELEKKKETIDHQNNAKQKDLSDWKTREEELKHEEMKLTKEHQELIRSLREKNEELVTSQKFIDFMKRNEKLKEQEETMQELFVQKEEIEKEIVKLREAESVKNQEIQVVQENIQNVIEKQNNIELEENPYEDIKKEIQNDAELKEQAYAIDQAIQGLLKEWNVSVAFEDVAIVSNKIAFRNLSLQNGKEEHRWDIELDRMFYYSQQSYGDITNYYKNHLFSLEKENTEKIYAVFSHEKHPWIHFQIESDSDDREDCYVTGVYVYIEGIKKYMYLHTGNQEYSSSHMGSKEKNAMYVYMELTDFPFRTY